MVRPVLRSTLVAAVAMAVAGTSLVTGSTAVAAASSAVTRRVGHVRIADYDLGATAFRVPGLLSAKHRTGPMELAGRVTYPRGIRHGRHPLVLMVPGYWPTCSDPRAQAIVNDPNSSTRATNHAYYELYRWPCATGTPALASYLGFDYLARSLAARGDVVVSISANGANAIDTYDFQGDRARTALISKTLRLWQTFFDHGRGRLARALPHQLVGHVDLHDVGLLGHSRAGRAVLHYASDRYRPHWPRGVTIKAVLGLAPAGGDPRIDYTTTTLPVALVYGSCDGAVYPDPEDYFTPSAARSPHDVYDWTISGANHDYWNTHWSPSSGDVGAYDDATPDPSRAHYCADTITSNGGSGSEQYVRQLSEYEQRRDGMVYVDAFFTDSFRPSGRYRSLLDGRHPLPGVVTRVHAGR